jgi:hypothetical protein
MPNVNIAGLGAYAAERDTTLRGLPYLKLNEDLTAAGIGLSRYDTKHTINEMHRKGGVSRPYTSADVDLDAKMSPELMKLLEIPIDPVLCYFESIDDITNYDKAEVAVNYGRKLDNKTFKHPWEQEIRNVVAISVPEDALLSVYHGVRKDDGTTSLDAYNGLFKQRDNLIAGGYMSAGKGNYIATPALIEVGVATKAWTVAVEFLKQLPLAMKRGSFNFKLSLDACLKIQEACEAKYVYGGQVTQAILQDRLRSASMCPGLVLKPTFLVGTGDYLEASVDDALEFSFHPDGSPFLQIDKFGRNPNKIQFWAQYKCATRIRTFSSKKFVTNDKSNAMPSNLLGDY